MVRFITTNTAILDICHFELEFTQKAVNNLSKTLALVDKGYQMIVIQLSKGNKINMDRKSEIIKATLELASENGLAAVSMNQIAEKLGISKPALYKHFESREEIIKTLY